MVLHASVGGLINHVTTASSHMLSVSSHKQRAPVQVESYSPRRHLVSAAERPPAAYQRYAYGQPSVSNAIKRYYPRQSCHSLTADRFAPATKTSRFWVTALRGLPYIAPRSAQSWWQPALHTRGPSPCEIVGVALHQKDAAPGRC